MNEMDLIPLEIDNENPPQNTPKQPWYPPVLSLLCENKINMQSGDGADGGASFNNYS